MSHHLIGDESSHPLAIVLESVASPLLVQHSAPVCLEVDIDHGIKMPVDSTAFRQLIDSLVRQALGEMPEGGELTVTACQTPTGVEVELADTGGDVNERACKLPMAAASVSAELTWQNCPQGGGAVTVKLPAYRQAQRRAA